MAKKSRLQIHVSGPARRDIAAILSWSLHEFGESASRRYEALISQALLDIALDPERPGSRTRPVIMIKGVRTYHLEFSRSGVSGPGVKSPRHLLLYRFSEEGGVEVGRILHDSRDLERHLPKEYRREPI